jgi:hypothetical protein
MSKEHYLDRIGENLDQLQTFPVRKRQLLELYNTLKLRGLHPEQSHRNLATLRQFRKFLAFCEPYFPANTYLDLVTDITRLENSITRSGLVNV